MPRKRRRLWHEMNESWMILDDIPWVMDNHGCYFKSHGKYSMKKEKSWIISPKRFAKFCHVATRTSFTKDRNRTEEVGTNFHSLEI